MQYTKPELTPIGAAVDVVSSGRKKNNTCNDADGSGNHNGSCPAYEADE